MSMILRRIYEYHALFIQYSFILIRQFDTNHSFGTKIIFISFKIVLKMLIITIVGVQRTGKAAESGGLISQA